MVSYRNAHVSAPEYRRVRGCHDANSASLSLGVTGQTPRIVAGAVAGTVPAADRTTTVLATRPLKFLASIDRRLRRLIRLASRPSEEPVAMPAAASRLQGWLYEFLASGPPCRVGAGPYGHAAQIPGRIAGQSR